MPSPSTPNVTVGAYTRVEAFAVARALEHAGITADVLGSDDSYRVVVPAEQADRARRLA
jgi:phage replication-related protein YjqB (UPF0714/DUF867 family)